MKGRGVSSDLAEAAKWVKRAAEHGDARGQFKLAVMYAQGQGVPKNADEADVWMHKSADQGLAAGEFGLARYMRTAGGLRRTSRKLRTGMRRLYQEIVLHGNSLRFSVATNWRIQSV